MRFIKGSSEDAVKHITERLTALLKSGQPVLWLTSGGSNAAVQTTVMDDLPDELSKILTIIPVDERYGPYNHADSNTAILRETGFNPKHAEWIDVLEQNLSPEATVDLYSDLIARKIATDDYIFTTLGMGADGHIAGILPHSPALHSTDLTTCYKADDYTRLTLCADTIAAHCDEAVLCVFGNVKSGAIAKLIAHDDRREEMPAMILQEVDNCTVFSDSLQEDKI